MVTVQCHSDKYQLEADGESEELWAARSLRKAEVAVRDGVAVGQARERRC